LEIKEIDELKGIKEFAEATRMGRFGGFAVENSRLMLSLISYYVKYYFSLMARQTLIFVRKILQGEENKGVDLTGGGGKTGKQKLESGNWKLGGEKAGVREGTSRLSPRPPQLSLADRLSQYIL
jgi:hypothetical protein